MPQAGWAQVTQDIALRFDLRGCGPRLLFISGTGGDLRRPATPFDRLLDAHFEVLRFDQRGMGQSSKPDVPYSMADYAADAAALMNHVGWQQALVLGYSFGGMVAQELALTFPERVGRLALVATTAGGKGGASYPLHNLSVLPPGERARAVLALADTRRDARWQAAHGALWSALVEDQLRGFGLIQSDPAGAAGAHRQLQARSQHDTWHRLPQLNLPVAVFGGQFDGIAEPAAVAALAERVPAAKVTFFDGGHGVHIENKHAAQAVVAWLAAAG